MSTNTDNSVGPLVGLNDFRRDLLFEVIRMDGAVGLRIKEALGDAYGEEINHGRLYPALDELQAKGLVERRAGPDDRSKWYEATRLGRREARAHHEWEARRLEGSA